MRDEPGLSRAEVEKRRLDKKRRRAYMRRRWGQNKSINEAAKAGNCGGVPELGHAPHVDFQDGINIDHIIPRSLGGSNEYGNLRPVCLQIHNKLNRRLGWHHKMGWRPDRWLRWQASAGVYGQLRIHDWPLG